MCNLYRLRRGPAEVAKIFGTEIQGGLNLPEETYPGYPGMVIRNVDGKRVAQQMSWGFPLRLKSMKPTSKPKTVNNARDDKLMTPFWSEWFTEPQYRCLIPFTEFAEAEGPKGEMTRTWISVKDQPIPAWAGLWRPSDEWGYVYTGVMVDATKELWHIHDRMPAILDAVAQDLWLNAPPDDALKLLSTDSAAKLAVEATAKPWISPKNSSKGTEQANNLLL
jgi:putative SOS response-associated peptidase YedK